METEICSECFGTGQIIIPCERCTGKFNPIGQVLCNGCTGNGSQLLECLTCNGTGFASNEYDKESVCV